MRVSADAGGCFPTGRHYPGIAHLLRGQVRGLVEGHAGETPMGDLPVVSIDVEATGLDPEQDRVVEVACVVFVGGRVERHGWLVNPGRPIPAEAQAVHHISDDDVKNEPPFEALAAQVAAALSRGVPLAYNADFDRAFLAAEFARCAPALGEACPALRRGVQWLDPLVWARHVHAGEKSNTLSAVCERLGIEIGQAHRATDDAEAAGHVHRELLRDPSVPASYGPFVQEQRRLARQQRDERAHWNR